MRFRHDSGEIRHETDLDQKDRRGETLLSRLKNNGYVEYPESEELQGKSATEIKEEIKFIYDVSEVQALKDAENEKSKPRKSLITAYDKRIKQIQDEQA